MFTSVEGCSVVVTGASKGIGKGIAAVFASAGADVLLCARDAASLRATAAGLGSDGARVEWVACDVSTPQGCATMARAATEAFGGIDVLCANAGIFPAEPLATMTAADLDQVLSVNVKGTIFAVQACLPALAASGRGRVVITSSITGPITGFPGGRTTERARLPNSASRGPPPSNSRRNASLSTLSCPATS